jgi:hypothetical protein
LGKFPEKLKEAQVVPCYKKSNALDKNHNILIFEVRGHGGDSQKP